MSLIKVNASFIIIVICDYSMIYGRVEKIPKIAWILEIKNWSSELLMFRGNWLIRKIKLIRAVALNSL